MFYVSVYDTLISKDCLVVHVHTGGRISNRDSSVLCSHISKVITEDLINCSFCNNHNALIRQYCSFKHVYLQMQHLNDHTHNQIKQFIFCFPNHKL